MKPLLASLLVLLSACDALPRDPAGTLERVQASGRIRVAIVPMPPTVQDEAAAFVATLERRTGARAERSEMSADAAFAALDAGAIDAAIGPFAETTPWETEAAFGPPLAIADGGDKPVELKPVVRNGENRWLMLIERTVRDLAPEVAQR